MSTEPNIDLTFIELSAATETYLKMKQHADLARRDETCALNSLNKTQAKLDEQLLSLRKCAPSQTDWHLRNSQSKVPVRRDA